MFLSIGSLGTWLCSVGTEWIPRREESKIFYQDLLRPLGIGAENEESSQHDVCYRSGHETRELDFEEWEEKWRAAVILLVSLVRVT